MYIGHILAVPCTTNWGLELGSTVFQNPLTHQLLCNNSMSFGGQTPTIVVLKEGTDSSQGRGHTISNIGACIAVADTLGPTLGPMGSDVLVVDANKKATISNDGATIIRLLDVVHPVAKVLVDISKSQDAEVGDGTTSVTLLAAELLREAKNFVQDNVSTQVISRGYRRALKEALKHVNNKCAVTVDVTDDESLRRCAATAMSSKIVAQNSEFFTDLIVRAVRVLGPDFDPAMAGLKRVPGGSIEDTFLVEGCAFKKTFSYAGFEQQPKSFDDPKIVCLDVELELKAEKDNAEVRVDKVSEYQAIVDAEWQLIRNKLEAIEATGCKIVLSKLAIGDLATQFFADRDIFCAGRVTTEDMNRVLAATGASIQSTTADLRSDMLGSCKRFEEKQVGSERFNLFTGCPGTSTCTLVLRGGSEQFIAEVERSLHDAMMVVKRTLKFPQVVAGGGACEMSVSKHLREVSRSIAGKEQLIVGAFARALEIIPRQLCENAGFDATDILNLLRMRQFKGENNIGVDFKTGSVGDNMKNAVWEPALVKTNALQSATEAACVVLSVDQTVKSKEAGQGQQPPQMPM